MQFYLERMAMMITMNILLLVSGVVMRIGKEHKINNMEYIIMIIKVAEN